MEFEGKKTSLQVSPELRDRLYRLKFRKTYEQFLTELCDLYEAQTKEIKWGRVAVDVRECIDRLVHRTLWDHDTQSHKVW